MAIKECFGAEKLSFVSQSSFVFEHLKERTKGRGLVARPRLGWLGREANVYTRTGLTAPAMDGSLANRDFHFYFWVI